MSADIRNNKPRKAHKNPRAPLACEFCRIRKIKCNRELPCQNCIVRSIPSQCNYRGHGPVPARGFRSAHAEGMQERLNRLESLVTTLVSQDQVVGHANPNLEDGNGYSFEDNVSREPETASIAGLQQGVGVLKVDGDASVYRGSTHWRDVMKEVNELRSLWNQVQDDQDDLLSQVAFSTNIVNGPGLLCGVVKPVGIEELLATIPPKCTTDKLIALFFDKNHSPIPTFHVLHEQTFMQQYEAHWENPSETKLMWIGLLFSMLSLIMLSFYLNEEEPPEYEGASQSLHELYRLRTAQCLMIGDITKCAPHTLETMIYNSMAEWADNGGSETRVWMMVGLLVRVALQMGYHRDPSQYPEIAVFHGELRRRVWAFVQGLDILTSFLVGLPSTIRIIDSDTMAPRNLHDWELTEDIQVLPESRPLSEDTPVGYMLAKRTIITVVGDIISLVTSLGQYSYEQVLELDDRLAQAYKELPVHLKMDAPEVMLKEHPSLVNRRIQLEFLYNQNVCILHRKFLTRGRIDPRYTRSYQRCMESAFNLLDHQRYLYTETKVRGTMKPRHWYRVSYTSHDFILAAMIVCLDVRYRKLEEQSGRVFVDESQQARSWQALEFACKVWKGEKDGSPEAAKVYQVLSQVLASYASQENSDIVSGQMVEPAVRTGAQPPLFAQNQWLGVPEVNMDIDWEVWDSFIEGGSFQDTFGTI
ncbi:hypothetical protein V8E51_008240 [Hyaloscypha variabilis]